MDVMVLSPHRDDAAFSCGLTLLGLLAAGRSVAIVNLCTRSRYAPYLTASPGDPLDLVSAIRRIEDERFAAGLIAAAAVPAERVSLVDLDWLDVPDRWHVAPEQALEPHMLDAAEVAALKDEFASLPSAELVLAPAAIGGHLDHRLVRTAATASYPAERLLVYEDLPYVCRLADESRRTEHPVGSATSRNFPAMGIAGMKAVFASCYPSQIDRDVVSEMEVYASGLGGRERLYGSVEALDRLSDLMNGGHAKP